MTTTRLAAVAASALMMTISAVTTVVAEGDAAKAAFIAAMRPPQERPVIAILASNGGTETTDFLVPFSVLQRADVATVEAIAPRRGPVPLMPAPTVDVATDIASFDRAHPSGAHYVIMPALHDDNDADVVAWLRRQADQGGG
jgi:putative intracellular protease/amidase